MKATKLIAGIAGAMLALAATATISSQAWAVGGTPNEHYAVLPADAGRLDEYDGNGGSINSVDVSVDGGAEVRWTKQGYSFAGWYSASDGSGECLSTSSTYIPATGGTYYAVFRDQNTNLLPWEETTSPGGAEGGGWGSGSSTRDGEQDTTGQTVHTSFTVYANPAYKGTSGMKFAVWGIKVAADAADENSVEPPADIETINKYPLTWENGYVNTYTIDVPLPEASTFPRAGVYKWTLCGQFWNAAFGGGAANLNPTYEIAAYIVNGEEGLEYASTPYTIKSSTTGEKVESADWNKAVEELDTLKISHSTTGAYADKTKEFSYTITVKEPSWYGEVGTDGDAAHITHDLQDMVMTGEATYDEATKTYTITRTFKDGEEATYTIPKGSIVTVTDGGADAYTGTSAYTAKDKDGQAVEGTGERSYNGDGTRNTQVIAFTETLDEQYNPIATGLHIPQLGEAGFMGLLAAAGLLGAMLLISKRRRDGYDDED